MHVGVVELTAAKPVIRRIAEQEVGEIQPAVGVGSPARHQAIECECPVSLERSVASRARPRPGAAECEAMRPERPVEVL